LLPIWQIKFRVQNVSYPQIPVEQPKESKPFAPMLVTVSILLIIKPFFAYTLFITLVHEYLKPHKIDVMYSRTVLPF